MIECSDVSFKEEVLDHEGKVLVDFWAPWCGPCKMLGPILESVASQVEHVKFVKINIDENPEVPTKHQVRSIPTLMLFDKGQVIDTKVGLSEQNTIIEWLQGKQ